MTTSCIVWIMWAWGVTYLPIDGYETLETCQEAAINSARHNSALTTPKNVAYVCFPHTFDPRMVK